MKKITLLMIATFSLSMVFAQKNVVLKINHKLANASFNFNQKASNNLNNDFNITRLEFYMSSIKIKHDGGQISNATDVFVLVKGGNQATEIDLGTYNINSIEAITFSIGVNAPINNQDPTLWPANHPLSPKSPSMHWGWTAGYRFVALEGKAGSNLTTTYEIHALGNVNYFENTISLNAIEENNKLVMNIYADYTKAINDINVSQGVISHGEIGESITLLNNFKNNVFSSSSSTGIFNQIELIPVNVWPNPSLGKVNIEFPQSAKISKVEVRDILGQLKYSSSSDLNSIEISDKGVYFISIYDAENLKAVEKVIVQ